MPTRIARIDTETDLAGLARALFDVPPGRTGAAALRRVEREILRLNRGLAEPGGFAPGARVIVPEIAGLTLTERVEAPQTDLFDLLIDASARLADAEAALETALSAAESRGARAMELARNDKFLATAAEVLPESAALARKAAKALKRASAETKARAEAYRAALAAAHAALERRIGEATKDD